MFTATTGSSSTAVPDRKLLNLNRLLLRLERNVLVTPPLDLSKSRYTRIRVRANVEHARTLLLDLEHSASSLTSKSKKSALQTDLQKKRELIKQLNQRLYELDQLDNSDSEGSADSEDEEEDTFPSYAPHKAAEAGLEVNTGGGEGNEALQNAARGISNELRRRGGAHDADVTASGNSLFPSKAKTAAATLSEDRETQEDLQAQLLHLSRQLKTQAVEFGAALARDDAVLDSAKEGVDSSHGGMEAIQGRLGSIRRMAEGKGRWDRLKLYAIIFGLWVAAFLIVFAGPKIRF
jgi:hypothetical protein